MQRPHRHSRFLGLALALVPVAAACNDAPAGAKPGGQAAPAVPKHEPTAARALQRSRERWALVEKADWVAAYEFMTPDAKRDRPLAMYLQNTHKHRYEKMRVIESIAVQDGIAYLRAGGLWTPQNDPRLDQVKLEPGQTLTQDIELVETWRWVGGDWFFSRPDPPHEFFELHPELRGGQAPSDAPGAGPAAGQPSAGAPASAPGPK